MKKAYTLLVMLFICTNIFAQIDTDAEMENIPDKYDKEELANNVKLFNCSINEMVSKYTAQNFLMYKENRVQMINRGNHIINMRLDEGQWYHFVFVGDPSSEKIRVALFKEGAGDIIQDKLGRRFNEFTTEFSYICPMTGIYEFTCFQRGEIERPLAYLMVFRKNADRTVLIRRENND